MIWLLLALLGVAHAQDEAGDASIELFYALIADGDHDGAFAWTTMTREEFDATWGRIEQVRLYTHWTGEVSDGYLLGHVDHCATAEAMHTAWAGVVRLKKVDGRWLLHDWDKDSLAYSIGDLCPKNGQGSMFDEGQGVLQSAEAEGIFSEGEIDPALADALGGLLGSSESATVAGLEGSGAKAPGGDVARQHAAVVGVESNCEECVAGIEAEARTILSQVGDCWQRAASYRNPPKGELLVRFKVDKYGQPIRLSAAEPLYAEVDECVIAKMDPLRFPTPPKRPYKVDLRWSLGPR